MYARKVTIFTDHKALKWLKEMKQPNGKLARWIIKLEVYDYNIEHVPGRMMQHADELSRPPVNSVLVSALSLKKLEEIQHLDIPVVKSWLLNRTRAAKNLPVLLRAWLPCITSFHLWW